MYHVLFYSMIDDFENCRDQYRQRHLEHIDKHVKDGHILIGGACGDPIDEGLIVFKAETDEIPLQFARSDIYVSSGIVKSFSVKKWNVVVGQELLSHCI